MRLPNPSISTTWTIRAAPSLRGLSGSELDEVDLRARPASGSPSARCAATGPKMSRPWNVFETGSSRYGESLISTTSSIRPGRRDQQAVVGPDEDPVAGADRDRPALRSDAGVDDGEVNARRRERQCPREPS